VARRNVVYVLDDDPDMLRGLERLLKVHGFRPKLFQSAETFFACGDNDDEAVCLLLDVHLNGVSGIDVKRQLMRSGARLPVIFITARDNDATRRLIAEVGCVAYLPKPFSAKSLVEAIALADQHNPKAVSSRD
jgi:FixJ family two-component response regulator